MTITVIELDAVVLEDYEFETPCDFGAAVDCVNAQVGSHDDPAEWIIHKRHPCGSRAVFMCDRCKTSMYDRVTGLMRCVHCSEVERNGEFWSRAERLNKTG